MVDKKRTKAHKTTLHSLTTTQSNVFKVFQYRLLTDKEYDS